MSKETAALQKRRARLVLDYGLSVEEITEGEKLTSKTSKRNIARSIWEGVHRLRWDDNHKDANRLYRLMVAHGDIRGIKRFLAERERNLNSPQGVRSP